MPRLKRYNGTSWVPEHVSRYNGSAFENAAIKRWSGSAWEPITGGFGEDFVELQSHDSGATWDIACSGDGEIVYVTDVIDSSIHKSTDGGATFADLNVDVAGNYRLVCCSSDGLIVYIGDVTSSIIRRSTDGGVTFPFTINVIVELLSMDCTDDGDVVYALDNDNQNLWRGFLTGTNWTIKHAQVGTTIKDVACSGDGTIVYLLEEHVAATVGGVPRDDPFNPTPTPVEDTVEGDGGLLKSTNSGVTFTSMGYVFPQDSEGGIACSASGDIVYCIGTAVEDTLYRSVDGGLTSVDLQSSVSNAPRNVCCSPDGSVVYICSTGTGLDVYKSS